MRRLLRSVAVGALLWCAPSCTAAPTAAELPVVGQPRADVNILEEHTTGPIVLLFPGRSAPADDPNLGILQTARVVADRIDGSVGVFHVGAYGAALRWVEQQSRSRRAHGATRRLALVGHSWGAPAAGRLLEHCLAFDLIDEVATLVTMDAIEEGYLWVFFGHIPSVFTLEILFPHRLCVLALTDMPRPDGTRFRQHINYYQIDSPHLSGYRIPTATQNHEVWFDEGSELGHGNLDNYVSFLAAEDVVRSLEAK